MPPALEEELIGCSTVTTLNRNTRFDEPFVKDENLSTPWSQESDLAQFLPWAHTEFLVDDTGAKDILRQIVELVSGDESDEHGILRPTEDALQKTCEVLSRSYTALQDYAGSLHTNLSFPKGYVTTDSEGGVRIEWLSGEKSVRLVVPSKQDGVSYIYHEDRDSHGTDSRVKGDSLAFWLKQLD